MSEHLIGFWLVLLPLIHGVGILSAIHAVLYARTAQGAIAWAVSLVTLPYLSLPLYWVLGRSKFNGYVKALRTARLSRSRYREISESIRSLEPHREAPLDEAQATFERLAGMPFTRDNSIELLIDGQEAFAAMFEAIDAAEDYVLALFYIVEDGQVGQRFKAHLLACARRGCRVYLLYDEVGSVKLPWPYIRELEEAGVDVRPFQTNRGPNNMLQFNFRNHRKILVVDGRLAFVGGMNIGDDYLGLNPSYGHWRDTQVRVEGPAVQGIQLTFCEDYYWATGHFLRLEWTPRAAVRSQHSAVYLSFGPSDILNTGVLFFVHSINAARQRLWLSSPYFIPDPSVTDALRLAAFRGVDVRIIISEGRDLLACYLAAYSYLPEIEGSSIQVYRYRAGHTHQKVMLIDDRYAWVGSANVDNRSMRLNFEGNLVVKGSDFAGAVEAMLEHDIENSTLLLVGDYERRSLAFKAAVQIARLFEPIL